MGTKMTAADASQWIQENNRSKEGYNVWRQMYGAVDLARQRELSAAKLSTEKGMADVFAEAYAAKQAVAGSNYFDAYKAELDTKLNTSLDEAYANYMRNYLSEASSINEAAVEQTAEITKAREYEAESQSALFNSLYDYLKYQYGATYDNEELEEPAAFWETPQWNKYITEDEEGEKRLLTWDELTAGATDQATGEVLRNPFIKSTGDKYELTAAGLDFADQMLNEMAITGGAVSYDDWLKETNPELYDYYSSYNPYTYAPKREGSDLTTGGSIFREMLGLRSTDQEYRFAERYGGLSRTQLNSTLESINKSSEAIISDKGYTKEGIKDLVDSVKKLTKQLGIDEEFEQELTDKGMTLDSYVDAISDLPKVATSGELASEWFTTFGTTALATGIAGAGIGSVVPAAGTVAGGVVGLIAGAIGGIIGASINVAEKDKQRKQDEETLKKVEERNKKIFANLVANLTAYAETKRSEIYD